MKFSSLPRLCLLALVVSSFATSASFAQVATPPVLVEPISDFTVGVNSAPTVIKLKKTFGVANVSGKIVRFSTSLGNVDVGLLAAETPQTVATFLRYALTTGDNNSGVYSYNNTLIQRAVPGFIVQGGGFFINSQGQVDQIVNRPTIPGEPGVQNLRGTIAMALSDGPDSGTGDFYFNIADNAMLDDTSDGGPFTVFGRVVGGLSVLDAIAALPIRDFSQSLGQSFADVPLVNFDGGSAGIENLVYLNSVTNLPLVPATEGLPSLIKLKLKSNSNPGLVTATLSGKKLTLAYTAGQTGSATIVIKAKIPGQATKAAASFTVTVQ